MIFIIPKEGREDIGKFAYYMYLSIVFITLSKEVSLESIFQVALLSHIFQTPPTGRQIPSSQYEVPASSDFQSPEIRSYLPVLTYSVI